MALLTLIATIGLYALAVAGTVFPLRYLGSRWTETEGGRSQMLSAAGLALLADVSVVSMWIKDIDPRVGGIVEAVVIYLLVAGVVYQNVLLQKARNRAKREKES